MKQQDIVQKLDDFFHVRDFDENDGWFIFMSEVHKASVKGYFVPDFWNGTWNGLMLDNATDVSRIYLVVFPTQPIIDTIIAKEVGRGAPGAMIFAHHPAAFDEKGVGFVQIPAEQLEELTEHQISYYNCHAPLDCNPEISTSTALANALGLNDTKRFADYYGGKAGVIGTIAPVSFEAFVARYAKVCELPQLRYDQILHCGQPVKQVAIVAGGGGETTLINEATALDADTFVTGHWHLFAENEFSSARREAFKTFIPTVNINLIGSSHYSSEMVVMRDQLKSWFEDLDLEVNLVRQEDPWGIMDRK